MAYFLLSNLALLTIILILFLILSMIWPPDSPWAPWWRTNKKTAKAFFKLAKVTKKDVLYELGSGDGMTLITAAQILGSKSVGIEVDPLRVWVAKILVKYFGVTDKVTITKKNFFEVDLSKADVVYAYLIPRALNSLEEKLLQELRPGTRVVSFVYPIDYLKKEAENKSERLFLYIIPQKKKK